MIAGLPEELLNELTEAWTAGSRARVKEILDDVADFHRADNLTRLATEYLLSNDEKLAEIFTAAGMVNFAENAGTVTDAEWKRRIDELSHEVINQVDQFVSTLYSSGNDFAAHLLDSVAEGGFDTVVIASILLYRAKAVLSPALLSKAAKELAAV